MGSLMSKAAEAVECLVDSFVIAAGIRVSNKQSVKERVEDAVDGSMNYSVSYPCLMDIPWLWVGDIESLIVRMTIGFESKFSMDRKNVICEMQFKLFHIFTLALPSDKLCPGLKEIFERNDMMIIVR